MQHNLFIDLPAGRLPEERIEQIVENESLRIVRIISTGQACPPGFWYDQDEDEWVVLLTGEAALEFENEAGERRLKPGDWLHIPAHCRHRVSWTSSEEATLWLAVFSPGQAGEAQP